MSTEAVRAAANTALDDMIAGWRKVGASTGPARVAAVPKSVQPNPREVPAERGDDFLTNAEAAALLRAHPKTLKRRVESDGFPVPVKFGVRVHYRRDEMLAYIQRKLDQRGRE